MTEFLHVLDVLGYVTTFGSILAAVVVLVGCVNGFLPVLIRLGMGLWRRKISVFARGDGLVSLNALLKSTKLFKEKNVIAVPNPEDLGEVGASSIFLVYWPDWSADIDKILALKKDRTALIVYAPQGRGLVPQDAIAQLEMHRNVVLCNFRGRLLNDLLVSMITTGYEKS